MRITGKSAVTVVFVALLAGCAGNNTLQSAPAGGAPAALGVPFLALRARHGAPSGSHPLSPNPCCVQTLFVSDGGANQVQLFKFPNGNYVGALPQPPETFSSPAGECLSTTNPQDVFVVNDGMSTIDEYTHGGVYVMHLVDAGEYPISCAYRQTGTGAVLAVGNHSTTLGGAGSVSVYSETGGVWSGPTVYTPPSAFVYFMDYKGSTLFLDLFVGGVFEFMSMSPGGAFTSIPLVNPPCPISAPGGVQHIKHYLAVGDQVPNAGCPNIDWVLPSGGVVGSTTLSPSPYDMSQFFRKGSMIVGPDAVGGTADIYSYPNGTLLTPISTPLVSAIGSAVSHQ